MNLGSEKKLKKEGSKKVLNFVPVKYERSKN